MRGYAVRYALAAAALTGLAVLVGLALARPAARDGVLIGGAIALGLQVVSFCVLELVLFPQRRLLAFAVGVVVRLFGFVLAALVLIPSLALPLGPTLLTLVAVFVLTNLLEPVIHHTAPLRGG
ncbi:MAG: hypothetical protein M3220_19645 [Chloroflexota bacterium]|nr:hypothetical protein [Chloroflexota bacterium]